MGLSGDGLHIKVLAAFSPVLFLCRICPFLRVFCEMSGIESSSATSLGLFKELLLCVPDNRAPQLGLWALNMKWAGIPIFKPHITHLAVSFYKVLFIECVFLCIYIC